MFPSNSLFLGNACGAIAVNHQLLAVNGGTSGSRNPGKRLFRQAGHLIAPRTKEMDVVAGTFGRRFVSVPAKAPSSVHPLNPVKQALVLQGLECPVHSHPVQICFAFSLFQNVLMRKGTPRVGEQLQDRFSCGGPPEPVFLQQLS